MAHRSAAAAGRVGCGEFLAGFHLIALRMDAAAIVDRLRFWQGYEMELETLGLYAVGIAIYGLLVYSLLSSVSKRDLFHDRETKPGVGPALLRGLRWLVFFPLFAFAYFAIISGALFFLAKGQSVADILLVSVSLVAGIRISSWLSEDVAHEIAKLVPIGLLGVLIVEPGYLSLETSIERFMELPSQVPLLWRYLLALFLVEAAAKPVLMLVSMGRKKKATRKSLAEEPMRRVPVATANPRLFPEDKRL